ncbi:MAG TPA: hypothetical protein DIW31_08250 [Bacteroidales bacterium]|nr:hypothetical protein [Bacteroidales bacterium]
MKWYPTLKDSIKLFINQHKRNPFPDLVNFSTEKPDTFGRKFWVKIEKIGIKKEVLKDELNTTMIYGKNSQIFPRTRTFGQIEVSKKGNVVTAKTKNVIRYTLLISPSHFDIGEPIEVYTNGILSFKGFVSKNLETLLKYYILDNDREMLYASEIEIKVGKAYKD